MSEYIERGALLKEYQYGDCSDVTDLIENFPAADVEPVVRCKNCEYSGKIDSIFQTWCKKDMRRVNNDFYCAHGKERER